MSVSQGQLQSQPARSSSSSIDSLLFTTCINILVNVDQFGQLWRESGYESDLIADQDREHIIHNSPHSHP